MYTAHFMHAVCHLQLTCLLSRKPSVCISVLMDWTASYSQSSYWLRNCCLSSCVHIVVFHCHWFFSPNVRCARQYSAPSYTTSVETTTMTNSSSLNPFYLVSRLKMSTPCTEGLAINFAVKCFLLWPTLIARASTWSSSSAYAEVRSMCTACATVLSWFFFSLRHFRRLSHNGRFF